MRRVLGIGAALIGGLDHHRPVRRGFHPMRFAIGAAFAYSAYSLTTRFRGRNEKIRGHHCFTPRCLGRDHDHYRALLLATA